MKKIAMFLGVMLSIFILPSAMAATISGDDFSGDLSQWDLIVGNYTIDSGHMKSAVATTTEAFSVQTFTEDEELTLSFRTRGTNVSMSTFVDLYINSSNYLRVQFGLGAGLGGNRAQFKYPLAVLAQDQNYSYDADLVWYYNKVYINGTDFKYSVWNESDGEPVDWMYEGTFLPQHAILSDGYRIRLYTANLGVGEYGEFDDILLTVPDVPYVDPNPPSGGRSAICGDGFCKFPENSQTCPSDCEPMMEDVVIEEVEEVEEVDEQPETDPFAFITNFFAWLASFFA